jgi:ATP/maltotriose-dependent transcriptional regulator MalT
MAVGLSHLAGVAAQQGDWVEAERLYQRSLAIARDIGDQDLMARALNGLGETASATGEYVAAGQHFADALRVMAEARFMRVLLMVLTSAADWLLQTGRPAEAAAPLALACAHPASDHETRPRARQLVAEAAAMLPPEAYKAAVERSQSIDPVDLAALIAPVLTAPLPAGFALASSPSAPRYPAATPALPEPLTARELSVLRLIAAGHSNREIADELFLSMNTVRSYSHQLYSKLGVGSRTQAVARARDLGLLT